MNWLVCLITHHLYQIVKPASRWGRFTHRLHNSSWLAEDFFRICQMHHVIVSHKVVWQGIERVMHNEAWSIAYHSTGFDLFLHSLVRNFPFRIGHNNCPTLSRRHLSHHKEAYSVSLLVYFAASWQFMAAEVLYFSVSYDVIVGIPTQKFLSPD